MVDDAVLVGREALDGDPHLEIRLRALERQAQPAAEDLEGADVVGAGHAHVIDALDPTWWRWCYANRLREVGAHARGGRLGQTQAPSLAEPWPGRPVSERDA
ncbi:MAG: hypothetical protein ACREKS_15330, partial [Candidatus Rokuibacteriota bacterium]